MDDGESTTKSNSDRVPRAAEGSSDSQLDLDQLEARIGYRFRERERLELALTHRSRSYERGDDANYERLEFLGDSVLGMVVADRLYRDFPGSSEGDLSRRKGLIVSAARLARFATTLNLGEFLFLGVGEERSGGRQKRSILADAVESLLGAIYVDAGRDLEAVEALIDQLIDDQSVADSFVDSKSRLQELSQAEGWGLPEYRLIEVSGAEHQKRFVMECRVRSTVTKGDGSDRPVATEGTGRSKKEASQSAARAALDLIEGARQDS